MTLKALEGFRSLETQHCVTGSMRHVYVYNGHDVSEDLLLGLGAGVGFVYWHAKGTPPFLGGRASTRGEFEPLACARTGVRVQAHTTSSARKAEQALLETLDAGQPVMVQVDMGFLPYFDFGGYEYHFGGHVVTVCGYDAESRQALLADREDGLQAVPLDVLAQARGSKYKPFPPQNRWYSFDFSHKRLPTPDEVYQAIAEGARGMLQPPISNLGVRGIRKAAQRVVKWPQGMDEATLRLTLFNVFIFIDATGGTGGGIFRRMYGRFLREAAGITGDGRLDISADEFERIAARWDELGAWFKWASEAEEPGKGLVEGQEALVELAGLEEVAWGRLGEVV